MRHPCCCFNHVDRTLARCLLPVSDSPGADQPSERVVHCQRGAGGRQVRICQRKNMHRHKRSYVGAVQSRAPLPESEGPLHELYLCGRQSGTDLVAGRTLGPELSTIYPGGDRLCPHLTCGCEKDCPPQATNHPRSHHIQTECPRRRVLPSYPSVQDEQLGDACFERYLSRHSRHVQQLQPVSRQNHQLGRDPLCRARCSTGLRVQLRAAGARVSAL
uniref:Uncharacterized protein n=1 Tax=Cacopsylla melanoneura TaxID=428564 RepID=A0A8D8RFG2_9HEMI